MIPDPETAKNISALPKDYCFGCGACMNTCPLDCIQMVSDLEGFLYPEVNEDICNTCHQCVDTCPGFNDLDRKNYYTEPEFYGGQIHNDDIRIQSSSGGFFTLLAQHILSLGGTVYGAAYDLEKMLVCHRRVTQVDGLAALRKSKYVQSDTDRIFLKLEDDLNTGLPVLFSGTPCQVAGVYHYLGKTPSNLFTIDIICHGVPSPGLFTSHFSMIEEKLASPLINIDFRTKDKGWGSFLNFFLKIETKDRKMLTYAPLDAYYTAFLANLSLRPVCFQCKFASTNRVADITLGDFWGVQKQQPDLFDGKGTSLVMVNTTKGHDLLLNIKEATVLKSLEGSLPLPPNLVKPSQRPKLRENYLTSIRFNRWRKQCFWKHLTALLVLSLAKLRQGVEKILSKLSGK